MPSLFFGYDINFEPPDQDDPKSDWARLKDMMHFPGWTLLKNFMVQMGYTAVEKLASPSCTDEEMRVAQGQYQTIRAIFSYLDSTKKSATMDIERDS